MTSLQHPESLNLLQKYRQACAILQNTSRATRMAWYKEVLALDFQCHIIVAGASVHAYFYNKTDHSWSPWTAISENIIADSEMTIVLGRSLIKKVQELKGRHLGVVVHIADEFATSEIKQKLNNPAVLGDLRQMIYDSPSEVLEDSSLLVDQASWRVIPYPASGSPMIATTIRVSRRLESFMAALRELGNDENFPIVTQAVSAPLLAIMGLPAVIKPSTHKPFVAVLQYPWFTAMAFFNEHSDLRLIRSVQHRGQRCPANFWSSLATTNASLEFVDPDIYLLPLGEQVETQISDDLIRYFPKSQIQTTYYPETSHLPAWAPSPNLCFTDTAAHGEEVLSHTFGILRTEKWFLQDFLPPSAHEQALFPSRGEIRLLRYFNIFKRVVIVASILLILKMGIDMFVVTSKPEWSFNADEAATVRAKMVMLSQEKARQDYWNSLLEDRSKAWSSMEMMARLFPEKSGILLRSFSNVIRADAAPKQTNAGFTKEWKISGYARNESIDYLNVINSREGISAKFTEIAKLTNDSSFDPTLPTRSIIVNLRMLENPLFKQMPAEAIHDSDPSTYSNNFELSIILRYEATDKLAIPKVKAP